MIYDGGLTPGEYMPDTRCDRYGKRFRVLSPVCLPVRAGRLNLRFSHLVRLVKTTSWTDRISKESRLSTNSNVRLDICIPENAFCNGEYA